MEINERVKEIRKAKKLNQEEFGKAIGLSASGISNIEYSFRKVTEKHIKMLCLTFNVNETWLRTGEGEMFMQTEKTIIETLAKKYALDDMDCAIIECYLMLPPSARSVMKSYLRTLTQEVAGKETARENAILRSRVDLESLGTKNIEEETEAHA